MKRIAFILFILIASVHTFAQTADEIVRTKYIFDKKIPSVIDIEQSESNKRNINDGKSYLEQLLQLNKETSAVLVDTYTDSIGGFHEVYKEYYKGIEVDGSKYTLHYNKDGNVYRASGCFWTIESFDTTARLSEKEALQSSMKEIGAEKYAWEDARSEQLVKDICKDSKATYYPKGKLFVHIKEDAPYLTYQFNINAVKPNLHYIVFVDANNGMIVNKYSTACEIAAMADTNYSGNNKTIQTSYENEEYNAYILHDTTRGNGITTRKWDFQHYTSDDNTWSQLSDYDRNAIDVHWGTERVYDFYLNVFNRNSLNGNGSCITSEVNVSYPNATISYIDDTAFIAYGFKDGITSRPYVSLDVIAHEFTHGVTNFTSQLANSGESGAINEGMSDIMAVYAEHWAKPSKNDSEIWKIGEDVYELRNLAAPNCNYYNGPNWGNPYDSFDDGYVHNNSGVFSYWAYLLTHGGSKYDPVLNTTISVEPIELYKVIAICYRTNIYKLSNYSNFASLSEYTYESAIELGYGTTIANQILKAWYIVGVMTLSQIMEIQGPSTIEGPSVYSVNNLPSGFSVLWSISDNTYNSSQLSQNTPNANQCTINVNSSKPLDNATLTAYIMYNAVVKTSFTKGNISTGMVGTYTNGVTTKEIHLPNPLYVMPNRIITIKSSRLIGATLTYSGNAIPTSWNFNSTSGVLSVGMPSTGTLVVNVSCSNGASYYLPIIITTNTNLLSISVTDGQIDVLLSMEESAEDQIRETTNNSLKEGLLWIVEVFNALTSEKVFSQKVSGISTSINTTGWKSGVYIIRSIINDKMLSEKVVIK